MKAKKRGKRPGLRARSKNARVEKKERAYKMPKRLRTKLEGTLVEAKESLAILNERLSVPKMHFVEVSAGAPGEGWLVLVRLQDGTYRFGMVLNGQFANYAYHSGEFVTMPHAERITHWMEVIPPVPDEPVEKVEVRLTMEEHEAQPEPNYEETRDAVPDQASL